MIVRAPLNTPDAPIPAKALPTMNMCDDFAIPDKKDPASNTNKKHRKVH
jgi:hypothetical protein